MESWQQLLRKQSIASLEALVAKFGAEHFPDLERLRQAAENFEFRISPAMVDLIKSPGDPIWRQYVPDLQELEVHDGLVDSLAEDAHSPVPNITHRYPDRALFLVSPVCASYCRFCTRRRKVGDPLPRGAPRDPRRDHVGRRPAAPLRPAHRGPPQAAARDPAS